MAQKPSGARARFIEVVKTNGWILDTTARRSSNRFGRETVQDPDVFVKPAADGGTWKIRLNYRNNSTKWETTYDDILRGVTIAHYDAEGKPSPEPKFPGQRDQNIGVLQRPGKYDRFNGLWEALGGDPKPKMPTLVQRAEMIVKDIETAVYLGYEANHHHDMERAEEHRQKKIEDELRSQKLPVTVAQGGWNSEWNGITGLIKMAAGRVADADGKSDLPDLLAQLAITLQEAVNALEPDASKKYAEGLAELTAWS
jgi:hypothetical protein